MERCRIDACLYNFIYDNNYYTCQNFYRGFYTSDFYLATSFCDTFNIEYCDEQDAMGKIIKIVREAIETGSENFKYKIEDDSYGIPQCTFIICSDPDDPGGYNVERIPVDPKPFFVIMYTDVGIFGEGFDSLREAVGMYDFYKDIANTITLFEIKYCPLGLRYNPLRDSTSYGDTEMHCDTYMGIAQPFKTYEFLKKYGKK